MGPDPAPAPAPAGPVGPPGPAFFELLLPTAPPTAPNALTPFAPASLDDPGEDPPSLRATPGRGDWDAVAPFCWAASAAAALAATIEAHEDPPPEGLPDADPAAGVCPAPLSPPSLPSAGVVSVGSIERVAREARLAADEWVLGAPEGDWSLPASATFGSPWLSVAGAVDWK